MGIAMRIFKKVLRGFAQPMFDEWHRNSELSFLGDEAVAQKMLMNHYRFNSFPMKGLLP